MYKCNSWPNDLRLTKTKMLFVGNSRYSFADLQQYDSTMITLVRVNWLMGLRTIKLFLMQWTWAFILAMQWLVCVCIYLCVSVCAGACSSVYVTCLCCLITFMWQQVCFTQSYVQKGSAINISLHSMERCDFITRHSLTLIYHLCELLRKGDAKKDPMRVAIWWVNLFWESQSVVR